ncbi:MAG TPA: D-alanine--D-alanine ligase family protein [Clostridiaceae bacterium]
MFINVGVFFGGRSVEHEVSVISALQAIEQLDKTKYKVVPIYIAKDGQFYNNPELLQIENYKDITLLLSKCKKVTLGNIEGKVVVINSKLGKFTNNIIDTIDIAFPIIHGTNGEDGSLQGYFETLNLPYVGCDILSSAVGMEKIFTKGILKEAKIPVVEFSWFYSSEWAKDSDDIILKLEKSLGYPMIVKPSNIGSSVGITKVNNKEELIDSVDIARKFSFRILVEKMIKNLKEINCSVLGDYDDSYASVCEEPITSDDILTYQDKYINSGSKGMGGAKRRIPADISEEVSSKIQDLSKETFKSLGCSGVIRIDFLIDNDSNKIYVNEINSIPGSLAFYLWEASAMKYVTLLDNLIHLALKKSREKKELTFSYDTNLLSLNAQGLKGLKK